MRSVKNWKLRAGIVLMIVSVPLYLALPLIPFLHAEGKTKIAAGTLLLVLGEVSFWAGGFLVGKELFIKYKGYLNPRNWCRKNVADESRDPD